MFLISSKGQTLSEDEANSGSTKNEAVELAIANIN